MSGHCFRVDRALHAQRGAARRLLVGRVATQPPSHLPGRRRALAGVSTAWILSALSTPLRTRADDRVGQRDGLPDPAGERPAVVVEALRRHRPDSSMQRQVVVELGDNDARQLRERPRPRAPELTGAGVCKPF